MAVFSEHGQGLDFVEPTSICLKAGRVQFLDNRPFDVCYKPRRADSTLFIMKKSDHDSIKFKGLTW